MTQNGQLDSPRGLLDSVGRGGFAYAWQMLRNREDALDAVQTSLASVWRGRSRLDPARDPRPWFFRVLRNTCIDMLRRRRGHATVSLAVEPAERAPCDPADALSQGERLARLRRALEELPDDSREILLLRDYHDLPYAEIALVLDIPAGTVMSRLHRARSALRERMLASEKCDELV